MALRVIWWEPDLEALYPVESPRFSSASADAVCQPLRLYDPADHRDNASAEEENPSYGDVADLRRQASLPGALFGFPVPLLNRLVAAAQWFAHQASSQ